MSEKLTTSYMWKWSFAERRCLIPMSSWDEWRQTGTGKQRVRVSMQGEPVFMAAGLFDENVNPRTGEKGQSLRCARFRRTSFWARCTTVR